MNKKSRKIIILFSILCVFLLPSLFNQIQLINGETPETSDSYTLYSNKNYPFHLDDFYDDEDLTHIYTDANFQKTYIPTDTTWNESISNVNNSESLTPYNTGVSMTNGTFDDNDYMHINDDSYSEFTADDPISVPNEYLYSITYTKGSAGGGSIANTQTDDGNYQQINPKDTYYGYPTYDHVYDLDIKLNIEDGYGGRDFYFSFHATCGTSMTLYKDTTSIASGTTIDFDDMYLTGVNNYIRIYASRWTTSFNAKIYYFLMVEDTTPVAGELNFTVQSPEFSNYERDDLLALKLTSNHYTNFSTPIATHIYDYDSSTWVELWNTTRTSEYSETYTITSNIDNYFDGNGKVKLKYYGSDTSNFKLSIDYIQFLLVYKLDLVHTTSFNMTGLWQYRWEVLGSIYYTDWVVFEVVDPAPNFYAISESDYTTRWILQNSTLSPVEDFHDDINTDYWNLVDTSSLYVVESDYITNDALVSATSPDNNYGDWSSLVVDNAMYDFDTYFQNINPSDYLYANMTVANSTLSAWLYNCFSFYYVDEVILYSQSTTSFDEMTITWNNKPDSTGTLNSITVSPEFEYETPVNYIFDIGSFQDYYRLISREGDSIYFISSEGASEYRPIITNRPSKNYFGDGYMYMQTNKTESIGLKSQDYGTHKTLSSGDYFEVDLQTNSDSKISLILYKDGVAQKTLTLSPAGNTNFNRRTVQVSVAEDLEFDQLKISSTFEDQDYAKVYDIKTFKYSVVGDYADFYISSRNQRDVYLTPDTYNLRIFEEGDEKVDTNITIGSTDYYYVYIPTQTYSCRLTLFNTEGLSLEFADYHIYVNRSLSGEYNQFALLDNIFSADEETYVYFDVYDRFDTLIDSFTEYVADYIDLELEVYQLQIKNLMELQTTVDINSSYTYPLLPYDSIYFMLSKEYYQIGYYDDDDDYQQFLIYLNSNQAYVLNRSKLCFLSYADQQGTHLSFENYKTYINNSLIYENIFYEDAGEDVNITIKDRYDIQIHSEIYTVLSTDNYIPITLTLYSLKIKNMQEVFNHINITRDPNYYESEMYWSEWIAPAEIIEFRLFAGYYKINLTDNEGSTYSFYAYTLSGDDILLISSDNTLANVIYNIANVNTTIGNQITSVEINLSNQNSDINNTIVNIDINLSNVNSTLGDLLTNINVDITNLDSDIGSLFTFTNTSFINLNNTIDSEFIYLENNIISINESISTLVIGIDNQISIVNGTITTMFTEMNNQFIVTQTTLNYSFAFLNQSLVQVANDIEDNHVILYNLIEQKANEINNSLINIQTLLNLVNSSVANESLVVQTLVNVIGNNMTNYYTTINNLLNLIDNNITNNNIQLVSILEVIGNNITTNHFIIENLLDIIGNNITNNHIELLTNLNLINTTIDQNQIELINRLLLINTTINDLYLDLSNQIILVNDTIYSAVLNLSTSVEFGTDVILGNLTLTYQQNEFLTELYKETMFSQLINWTGAGYNYSIMEDRIDVWEFINNYRNDSITVFLKYNDQIENLTVSAQNTIDQFLPVEDVEYRLWSVEQEDYLTSWEPLPENRTVDFGFYQEEIPDIPDFNAPNTWLMIVLILMGCGFIIGLMIYLAYKYRQKSKNYERSYRDKITLESESIKGFFGGRKVK